MPPDMSSTLAQYKTALARRPKRRVIFALVLSSVLTLIPVFHFYSEPDSLSTFKPSDVVWDPFSFLPAFGRSSEYEDRALLVTAFFPLPKSKHTDADYDDWLSRFMGQIVTDMYIFTTPQYEERIRTLVENARTSKFALEHSPSDSVWRDRRVFFDVRWPDPYDIPALELLKAEKAAQEAINPYPFMTSGLFAIWNGKTFFTAEGMRQTTAAGYRYKYYFWQDGGSFRTDHAFEMWPDIGRLDKVFSRAAEMRQTRWEELLFFAFWRPPTEQQKAWTEEGGPITPAITQGSFFGGHRDAITWLEEHLYPLLDRQIRAGFFVGDDQMLYNLLGALHPNRYFGPVPSEHHELPELAASKCGLDWEVWWYYHYWVASERERAETEEIKGFTCPLVPVEFPWSSPLSVESS